MGQSCMRDISWGSKKHSGVYGLFDQGGVGGGGRLEGRTFGSHVVTVKYPESPQVPVYGDLP